MRLLTDENFNGAILRGLIRRLPNLDIVRIQDVGLMYADDPTILEWAANENRLLLTHDVATITMYAYGRVNRGLPMPGVIEWIWYSVRSEALKYLIDFLFEECCTRNQVVEMVDLELAESSAHPLGNDCCE